MGSPEREVREDERQGAGNRGSGRTGMAGPVGEGKRQPTRRQPTKKKQWQDSRWGPTNQLLISKRSLEEARGPYKGPELSPDPSPHGGYRSAGLPIQDKCPGGSTPLIAGAAKGGKQWST